MSVEERVLEMLIQPSKPTMTEISKQTGISVAKVARIFRRREQ